MEENLRETEGFEQRFAYVCSEFEIAREDEGETPEKYVLYLQQSLMDDFNKLITHVKPQETYINMWSEAKYLRAIANHIDFETEIIFEFEKKYVVDDIPF